MGTIYEKLPPIGQFDDYSCWAASLSWWLKAVGGGRPALSQGQLISEFSQYCDENGGMPPRTFRDKVCTDARFRLKMTFVSSADLSFYDISEPKLIAYYYPEAGGTHMNVVFKSAFDGSAMSVTVGCMEPFYPINAATGQRRGKILRRSLTHFINTPEIGLASAID